MFTEKSPEKFTRNETQWKIIEMMLANPNVSRDSIAAEIGITTRGIQKSINTLKELGLIERIGAAESGNWAVKTETFIEKIPEMFTEKSPEKFTRNETERKTKEMMFANPKVIRDSIAVEIGIATRGIQKSNNALKGLALIKWAQVRQKDVIGQLRRKCSQKRSLKVRHKSPGKFTKKFPEKFTRNETQRKIIEMMFANAKAISDSIATEIGIATRGIQKSNNALKGLALIKCAQARQKEVI
jgi:predicted HTH transcriptional regulator